MFDKFSKTYYSEALTETKPFCEKIYNYDGLTDYKTSSSEECSGFSCLVLYDRENCLESCVVRLIMTKIFSK